MSVELVRHGIFFLVDACMDLFQRLSGSTRLYLHPLLSFLPSLFCHLLDISLVDGWDGMGLRGVAEEDETG